MSCGCNVLIVRRARSGGLGPEGGSDVDAVAGSALGDRKGGAAVLTSLLPPNASGIPRCLGEVESDPVQQKETQIVQSGMQLNGFFVRSWPPTIQAIAHPKSRKNDIRARTRSTSTRMWVGGLATLSIGARSRSTCSASPRHALALQASPLAWRGDMTRHFEHLDDHPRNAGAPHQRLACGAVA